MIRKKRLILKFMMSQPGKQRIAINIWHNISRSKENQTMKFVQLIEHNVRNVFLQKSYTKNCGKTILFFSNFVLYSKGCHFSITRFDIIVFSNEMNFGNFY